MSLRTDSLRPSGGRPKGFSLLEMLVVMTIVGLVSGILFQALGQVYKLQSRFGLQLAQSRQGVMYMDWFRQIVQGLQTDFADGDRKFHGEEMQWTGVTTAPLAAGAVSAYGTPVPVTLSLQYDMASNSTTLLYAAGETKAKLFSWEGRKGGRFIYLDDKGERHDTWPPPFGLWPQLPSVILLQEQSDGEPLLISAVPRSSPDAKIRTIVGAGLVPL